MYSRILNCDYEFVSPWWDEVSLNAKDLVSFTTALAFSNKNKQNMDGADRGRKLKTIPMHRCCLCVYK